MGVGYQVTALDEIRYSEPIEGAPLNAPSPTDSIFAKLSPSLMVDRPPHEMPSIASILTWCARLSLRYRDQLGTPLDRDEASMFF
jgi:hypothetical protein